MRSTRFKGKPHQLVVNASLYDFTIDDLDNLVDNVG